MHGPESHKMVVVAVVDFMHVFLLFCVSSNILLLCITETNQDMHISFICVYFECFGMFCSCL